MGTSAGSAPVIVTRTLIVAVKPAVPRLASRVIVAQISASRPMPQGALRVPGATMAVPFALVDVDKSGDATAPEWAGLLATVDRMKAEHGLLAIKSGGRGDVTATNVVWREKRSVPEVPSPLVYENRVYYVRNGGILTCLEAATGRVVYRERLGAPGPYYSSPIAAGGRLFIGSGDGTLVVFAPGDALKVLARNELGEPIFATPAVSSEGILYVRTPSALYAFAER